MKKIVAISLIIVLTLTSGCTINFNSTVPSNSNSNNLTSSLVSGTDSSNSVDSVGINPYTIIPDDSYYLPQGKYMDYSKYKFFCAAIADELNYSISIDIDEESNAFYLATWSNSKLNTTFKVNIVGSGNYVKYLSVTTKIFENSEQNTDFATLCACLSNLLDEIDYNKFYIDLGFFYDNKENIEGFAKTSNTTNWNYYLTNINDNDEIEFSAFHRFLGYETDFKNAN